MKYLETKHERNSAKITSLIMLILLLLLFVVGPPYMDPPLEYGVAVNFGTSDVGSGDIQPTEPIKSEPREVVPQIEETKSEPTTPSKSSENVLTADNAEAIAIKKQKEIADAKAKADAQAKAAEAKKKQEEASGAATQAQANDIQAVFRRCERSRKDCRRHRAHVAQVDGQNAKSYANYEFSEK